jgi:Peptidase family M28
VKPRWPLLAALVAILAFFAAAYALTARPPAVVPASAPPTEFSAERALETVRAVTEGDEPHPPGSDDHARVALLLIQRLRDLGLQPQQQQGKRCGRRGCADLVNLIARIEGAEQGPALLLAAHYDSVPYGPGASDDGAGVATVLEIARAILAGPKPKRPVILLLDDGEELGLYGAHLFVEEHGWASDVGVVLNFEARGTGGQTAMFETSDRSADLVEAYGRSARRPTASSVIYALYKQLPNDTDMTVFKAAGMRGLNFAYADRVWHYHTADDDVAHLDPRSLQHMGDQGLASARAILDATPSRQGSEDAVYFDLFTYALVVYRARWALPLAALAAAIAILGLHAAVQRKRATVAGIAAAAWIALGAVFLAGAAGLAVASLIGSIRDPIKPWTPGPLVPWIALLAAGAFAATLLFAAVQRLCPLTRIAGGLVVWTLSALLLAYGSPGASYLFTFPALGLGAALLLALRRPPGDTADDKFPGYPAALVPFAVTALLWFPIMRVLLVMVGAGISPTATVPAALVAGTAAPALASLRGRLRWAPPIAALGIALIFTALAAAGAGR